MTRDLPSLHQLRAFEAAARFESVKDGAAELCVTQAAVSHQIKALETALGTPLFIRAPRKLTLTEKGRALAREVGAALDILQAAVDDVTGTPGRGPLRVSVAPFFANRWLLPRLHRFHRTHPDVEIAPALSFDYADLAGSGADAALRYGDGHWPGLQATPVFTDEVGPVCAPQLVAGRSLPLTAEAILALPRASAARWAEDWGAWAASAGLADADVGTVYESRALMFDAALSGSAAILADHRLTAVDEAAGRLIRLSGIACARPQGIYAVTAAGRSADPRLRAFVRWLRAEAGTA